MKRTLICVLMWLSAIFTIWTPTRAHASCAAPPLELYWMSIEDGETIAANQSIFIAHSPEANITATLNGEALEAVSSGSYHTEYRPASAWPTDEANALVLTLEGLDVQQQPSTLVKTVSFSVDEQKVLESGTQLSILSSAPSPQVPEDICQTIFQKTFCSDDSPLQPQGLELSGEAVAYMVEVPELSQQEQPNRILWPGECAPQVDKTYAPYCYRIIAFDALGQQHVGPENCALVPEDEPPGFKGEPGCSSTETRRGAPLSLSLLLMLGALLRRKPS